MTTDFLQNVKRRVDACLIHEISNQHSDYCTDAPLALKQVSEAAEYCTANGGKRLRSALFIATLEALSNNQADAISTSDANLIAASIECIHSYSLIHDDLPAMDNDDLRRGQATCHIAYNEALAILVGDG
ncbi:MAG: polyprenyl synthetase family protein, partial [Sinobacterium sp.]|nr:polyprenyl synthetase family protein [Sinobacterium sp.]